MASAEPGEIDGARRGAATGRRGCPSTCCRNTRAYYEIWLDGEKVAGSGEEDEPIYGADLPAAQVQDRLRRAAAQRRRRVRAGPRLHRDRRGRRDSRLQRHASAAAWARRTATPETYPRLADVIGFVAPDQVLAVAEAVVTTQRDFGDRSDAQARAAEVHDRRSRPRLVQGGGRTPARLRARAARGRSTSTTTATASAGSRAGRPLAPDAAHRGRPRRRSRRAQPLSPACANRAACTAGDFRLTPNQNLIIAGVAAGRSLAHRRAGRAARARRARDARRRSRRNALACVALPTCGLAMAEAERYLPAADRGRSTACWQSTASRDAPILLRISGCPNGCSRPYLARDRAGRQGAGPLQPDLGADRAASGSTRCTARTSTSPRSSPRSTAVRALGRRARAGRRLRRFPASQRAARHASCVMRERARPGNRRRPAGAERRTAYARAPRAAGSSAPRSVAWPDQARIRAVVELRRAGGGVAAPGHAARPGIPVILIDTGYLFPETYRFVDELDERLRLNLKVYRPARHRRHGWKRATASSGNRASTASSATTGCARSNRCSARSRAWRRHLVRRPAPQSGRNARRHRACAAHRPGSLEGASDRRLERSRRLGLPEAPRPALSPAVGAGLRLDRRLAHHALAAEAGDAAEDTRFFGLQARVRAAPDRRRGRTLRMRHLPVFLDLQAAPALVVGGGRVAARKLALLRASGRRGHRRRAHCLPGNRGAGRPRRDHLASARFRGRRRIRPAHRVRRDGRREANATVARAARAAGIPVNVVDDGARSSFIVPAIVDRSPLLVAISSGGVAPMLATAVRARVEALLDHSWARLAGFAERWRKTIRQRRPSIPARRLLYEWLLDGPVSRPYAPAASLKRTDCSRAHSRRKRRRHAGSFRWWARGPATRTC